MKDLDIIKALMSGDHLEPSEIVRAKQLVHGFKIRLGM